MRGGARRVLDLGMDGYGPSIYGDRIADVYDDWYGERLLPDDAVAFLAPLAAGGRVLELGIGTGRVALPLAACGLDVSGVDASSRMVEKLRAKAGGAAIPVVIGDFADVEVEGTFRLVYVAFTTFFALPSQEVQLRCLRRVAEVLEPGGRFVVEVFVPDVTRYAAGQSTTTMEAGGDHVLLDAMRHDPVNQVVEGHHVLITEGSVSLYPLRLRYCWPAELDVMARLSGLELEERVAWYDRAPFDARSTRHVSVYRRP
jgi:SAM-dependent methyltransferase